MNKRWLLLTAAAVLGLVLVVWVVAPWFQRDRLVQGLHDENPAVRAAAIRRLPWGSDEALLIERLTDDDDDVRLLAAERLGGEGPNGEERAWALVRSLKDPHAGVRREAARSLGLIGPDAWPAIREALNDADARVRMGAAIALEDACSPKQLKRPWPSRESDVVVPALRELLDDADPEVCCIAKEALGRVQR